MCFAETEELERLCQASEAKAAQKAAVDAKLLKLSASIGLLPLVQFVA